MNNNEEYYILGIPIETKIGTIEFIKVKEFPEYIHDLNVMSYDKLTLVRMFEKLYPTQVDFLNELRKCELYDMATQVPDIRNSYKAVFTRVMSEESLSLITEKNFYEIRDTVLKMNSIKEVKTNPNPEIQEWIEKARRAKQSDDKITFSDIASSIVVASGGISYKDLADMTVYQFFMTYYRIAQIKTYDTSTLFATVSPEATIEHWDKHIDMFKEENHTISRSEFQSKSKSIFGK